MKKLKDKNDYKNAIETLNLWAKHYYELDDPIASDGEYDALYTQVIEYEKAYPHEIDDISPSVRVGGETLKDFSKNAHLVRMWSLEDVFNKQDLEHWLEKLENAILRLLESKSSTATVDWQNENLSKLSNKNIKVENLTFCISPKFDGMSLNVLYEGGVMKSATTRGDGEVGELVSENARMIASIPQHIAFKGRLEVRGEVVMAKQTFEALNAKRESEGKSLFANPRNATSGSMRQLDPSLVKERKLDFIPWGVGFCDDIQNLVSKKGAIFANGEFGLYQTLFALQTLGFKRFQYLESIGIKDIQNRYEQILESRDECPFMLDGCVVVLDDLRLQKALGFTQKAPRFAFAYKFPATEVVVRLDSVDAQVGRSGIITPVANFSPTLLQGANISRATLHNYKEIARKDVRVGDFCLLVRSGDVIPKITKVLKERRSGSEMVIEKPVKCPVCSTPLSEEDIFIYCINPQCDAIIKSRLTHFVSKKCLNIDGLGRSIIAMLVDSGLVKKFRDVYDLNVESVLRLEGFKEKKAKKLIDSIKDSVNNRELWRFIHALGIMHIGEVASKSLARFGLDVFSMSVGEISLIDGFGVEMANSFYNFCVKNQAFIEEMVGVVKPVVTSLAGFAHETYLSVKNLAYIDSKNHTATQIFNGKTCVITGTFNKTRYEIKQILESLGAKVSGNVSAKTHFLLAGQNAGSKLKKAKELGIEILDASYVKKTLGM